MYTKKLKWASPLFIIFLALASVFGATSAIIGGQKASEEPLIQEAKATTYSGSIGLECKYINSWNKYWDSDNAKIALWVWNDSGSGWSSMISCNNTHYYSIPYSFEFDPFGATMIALRMDSSATSPDWGKEWNRVQTSFGQVLTINENAGGNIYDTAATYMHFDSYGWEDTISNRLSNTQRNGSGHWEYYNTSLTFHQNDYGGVKHSGGSYYGDVQGTSSDYVYKDGSDTRVNYYGEGYQVYFDTTNKNSYYGVPDRAVAEKWGAAFLDTIKCTGTSPGAVTSSDDAWNKTMKDAYDGMTTDQQGEVWTATANPAGTYLEQAVNRYDFIIRKYGESKYGNFVGRHPANGAYRGFGLGVFGSDDNNITTIIIVVASSVALLSVTALSILVIKKRKQKEE